MKKKLIIVAVVLVGAMVAAFMVRSGGSSKNNGTRVEYVTTGDLSESLMFEGVVTPSIVTPVYVNTPTVVENLYINEGSVVKKGENLMEFSQITKQELAKELEINELDMQDARLQLEDLESGSMKLELDNKELEIKTLEEQLKTLNRQLKVTSYEAVTLRKEADVKMELLANDGISSIEANRAISMANQKEVDLQNMQMDLELSSQKYQLVIQGFDRLKRELNLTSARINGSYKKLELQRETLQREMDTVGTSLRAPVDGVIVGMNVVEGSPVGARSTILSIAEDGENMIKIDVPIYQAKWLEVGQAATVTSKEGFEDRSYNGLVRSVSNVATIIQNGQYEDRVIQVEVDLENGSGLRPGYAVDVEVDGNRTDTILTVDAFSVMEENGINFVYMVEDGRARKTPIDVGARTLSKYEVLNLPEGTPIVVNPFRVRDGERLQIVN